ncbi:MAG: SDR family oxidoreductase [Armatimonadota bacterium]|nr:SDR family oxidoreductase [Armatimonadota bacterium]
MKRALVTGAGGGIGQAIVRALLDAGYRVIATDRDADALRSLQGVVTPQETSVLDVADVSSIAACFARVEPVDVLVNCAGVQIRRPALEVTPEQWDHIHAVNLRGLFFCSQAAAQSMARRGGGVIINVASILGVVGRQHNAAYAASKGGIVALTRTLAVEWAPLGIRVNAIAPGLVWTAMTADLRQDPAVYADVLRRIPVGRFATPEEIAPTVVFLASDDARYVTGEVFVVDGGYTAQ